MGPMGVPGAQGDGSYSDRIIRFYEERAKGGCGMIITGRNASVLEYEGYSHHALANKHHSPQLNVLIDRCHAYGAKVCVQIGPGLGRLIAVSPTEPPYSCSAIPSFWYPNLTCKVLSVDDIHFITDKVGYSASLAMHAGADAVELHAYGSYLADQFMTEAFNHRTDEYGGSLENRVRMLGECIQSIQKYCGKDFPQIVKFTPVHVYDAPGYRKLEEGLEIAKLLEQWGAHALHVDTGCYEMWYQQIPTVYQEEACQLFAAEAVKNVVSIPVLCQGKLQRPELAEQILQDGKADLIVTAHQQLCDPWYSKKVADGNFDDIRPCIGCNECLLSGKKGVYHCSVNPVIMHEDDMVLTPFKEEKAVLVIGGGPGGMQAAIAASERGARVELWEKSSELGGLMIAAGSPSFKKDVMDYVMYLRRQMAKLGVNVVYGKEASAEDILAVADKYDRVVIATGSVPAVPPIPGVENAVIAADVLRKRVAVGDRVVVIGGGLVGCETALEQAYAGKEVTVLEMRAAIPPMSPMEESTNNLQCLRDMIKNSNIKPIANVKTTKVEAGRVTYVDAEGKEYTVDCDTVILAAGYHANETLSEKLLAAGVDCWVIGDADKPGKIVNATRGGYDAVLSMM